MAEQALITRRRALSIIPAIGAATIVPAATVAAHNETPEERAARAWAEFEAAMNELTAETDGWQVMAGSKNMKSGNRKEFKAVMSTHLVTEDVKGVSVTSELWTDLNI